MIKYDENNLVKSEGSFSGWYKIEMEKQEILIEGRKTIIYKYPEEYYKLI